MKLNSDVDLEQVFGIIVCVFEYDKMSMIAPGVYKPPKEHETYTACRVPSQSKSIASQFPYKESTISLFEAVYEIVRDDIRDV